MLSVATIRNWKNRETGECVRGTTWHRCIVWAGRVRFAATLTKGAHVQIEGTIRNYQLPAKGEKAARLVTEVIVDRHREAGPSTEGGSGAGRSRAGALLGGTRTREIGEFLGRNRQ